MVFYALVPGVPWIPVSKQVPAYLWIQIPAIWIVLLRVFTGLQLLFEVRKGWEDELICNDTLHYSFFASAIKLIVGFPLFKLSVATVHNNTNIQDAEDNEHGLRSS